MPRAALNIQRGLALLMLAAVLGVAVVERGSPFASRVRASKPWPFWLSLREPGRAGAHGAAAYLGVYHPARRILVLIRIPETTRLQGKLTAARAYADALRATDDEASASRAVEDLAQIKISALSLEPISWEGAGRLALELEAGEEDDEPAVAAARALKARGRSPRALWSLARRAAAGLSRGDRAAADALLLTLELRRTPLEGLEPALLPEDAAAPAFLAHAFAPDPEPRSDDKPIVVEVLNGTGSAGLAAQAAKVLRSKGVDVMALGQAPRPRSRTVVYDRTGDFDRAARVRAALGCPTAIAATRIDALRGVDASVELGADCSY
ncbi:MAG: LytR C-terminal domain-containing protein [Elusimicrobia bacterium]|nr:LytR C-terminal domain-containing protein [Elusimicrobiota bacterium]